MLNTVNRLGGGGANEIWGALKSGYQISDCQVGQMSAGCDLQLIFSCKPIRADLYEC